MIEKTTPTTVMTAAAIAVRICLAAVGGTADHPGGQAKLAAVGGTVQA